MDHVCYLKNRVILKKWIMQYLVGCIGKLDDNFDQSEAVVTPTNQSINWLSNTNYWYSDQASQLKELKNVDQG